MPQLSKPMWKLLTLADNAIYSLDQMPATDASIATLIVSTDEALTLDACCPHLQCRITDDFLTKSYDLAAWILLFFPTFSSSIYSSIADPPDC